MAERRQYSSMAPDLEADDELVPRVPISIWIASSIGGIILLAILGIVIANLVITEDNQDEVNNIWHSLKGVKSITVVKKGGDDDDDDDKECDKCLQPFGPCTKRLPKLLKDYPCCVTLFEDKIVAKIPLHPKRRHDSDYDGPESRWSYASMNHKNCRALNEDAVFDMEDAQVVATNDDSFLLESEPQQSVGPGELGPGTGMLDTIKFAMGPSGSYMVKQDTKIVLQAVITATVKLPKWHPYEWEKDRDDPRLGHTGAMLWDWESGISAGVVFTEQGVWTMYNRHPGKHGSGNWHSAKRHYDNPYEKQWCIRIIFCSKTRTITFYINDKEVYVVNKVGGLPDHDHRDMFVYRGGEPNEVEPESFRAFLMGGTVLDAAIDGGDEGLLQLDDYSYVEPSKFRHGKDKNDKDKRVYGQKFLILVTKFKVDICERAEEEDKSRKEHSSSSSSSDDRHHHKSRSSSDSSDSHKKKKKHDDKSSSDSSDSHDKKKHDDKSRSDSGKGWKEREWKEEDWKKDKPSWNFEEHSNSEKWNKEHKVKWENSNSELWKKWDNDFVHQRSESEKHAEENNKHHEKSENWKKVEGG